MHILQLNEYCLKSLIDYLEVEDKFKLSHVCAQFQQLVLENYKLANPIYEWQYWWNIKSKRSRQELLLGCKDIEIFKMTFRAYMIEEAGIIGSIIKRMKALKRLCLMEHTYKDKVMNNEDVDRLNKLLAQILMALTDLPALKDLKIIGKRSTRALKCLSSLKLLQKLSVDYRIDAVDLIECFKSNPELRAVRLTDEYVLDLFERDESRFIKQRIIDYKYAHTHVSMNNLLRVVSSSGKLDYLQQFTNNIPMDVASTNAIGSLKSLTKLTGYFKDAQSMGPLIQLISLEELQINCFCGLNYSSILLNILENCTKLKIIEITYGFIDSQFISDVIKTLKSVRDSENQMPLRLQVREYRIYESEAVNHVDPAYLDLCVISSAL